VYKRILKRQQTLLLTIQKRVPHVT